MHGLKWATGEAATRVSRTTRTWWETISTEPGHLPSADHPVAYLADCTRYRALTGVVEVPTLSAADNVVARRGVRWASRTKSSAMLVPY